MAGLIQKSMQGSAGDEQMEKEPVEGTGPDGSAQHEGMEGETPEANDDSGPNPDTDPGFQQATQLAMEALYGNEAAKDVAKSLKGAQNIVDGLANTAYEIVSIVDERTDGAVPDELLVLFATNVLEEVAEIADAAGLAPTPADVASALKQMILRYLGEQGVDTTQLQQAMDQVNPEDFNQMAAGEESQEVAAGAETEETGV